MALVAVLPSLAMSQAAIAEPESIPESDLQALSVGQLCGLSQSPEALAELAHRELFSGREMRAIKRDRVRNGIGEDALLCIKGRPESIVPAAGTTAEGRVDAYVYSGDDHEALIVYVRQEERESIVVHTVEADDPLAFAPNGSTRMVCTSSGGTQRCEEAEGYGRLDWSLYGPGTDEFGFPFGTRRSGADVATSPAFLGSTSPE